MVKGNNFTRVIGGAGGAMAMYELIDVARDGDKVLGVANGKVLRYGSNSMWAAADNIPVLATNSTRGGIQIGYTTDAANRNYAVQLSSEKAYVNVPWTDHYDWRDLKNKPTNKTAWGQTYWDATGEPTNISGNMTGVGNIAFAASGKNIGGFLYFDTTNSRLGVGTSTPTEKLHVSGNAKAVGYLISERTIEVAPGQTMTNTVQIGSQSASYTHISASENIPFLFNRDVYVTGAVTPETTNAYTLGDSNRRWNTAYINYIYGRNSCVGIQTTSPAETLDVAGVIHASTGIYTEGYLSGLSDERLKNVMGEVRLTVEQLAKMPIVRFTWRSGMDRETVHVGTLAQAWQGVMPEVVHETSNGRLMIEYQVAALAGVVTNSRRIMKIIEDVELIKKALKI